MSIIFDIGDVEEQRELLRTVLDYATVTRGKGSAAERVVIEWGVLSREA